MRNQKHGTTFAYSNTETFSYVGKKYLTQPLVCVETNLYGVKVAMRIIIGEHDLEWDLSGREVTLQQVVDEVETFLFSIGKVPIGLIIDGHALTQEELDSSQEKEVTADQSIEFETSEMSEFLIDNLQGANQANAELINNINTFADELYASTKSVDPKEVIENIRNFFFFWTRLHRLIPKVFEPVSFEGKTFQEWSEDLQEIFKEIVGAMEDEDCVLAADLLQYEIIPAIEAVDSSVEALQESVHTLATQGVDEGIEKLENVKNLKKGE
jgi:hypothetical protein